MIPAALVVALLAQAGGDEVVARVGEVAITAAEVRERAARPRPPKVPQPRPAELLAALVDDVILAAEGRRTGVAERFVVRVSLETARRQILGDAFVEQEIAAAFKPTEAQLRELFHQREDAVKTVVLTYTTPAEAQAALDRLRAGADLTAEAARSLDPRAATASTGPTGGLLLRGQLDPALAAVVFSGPLDTWVGPIKLALGHAVARTSARSLGEEATFLARRESIARYARQRYTEEAKAHFVSKQRAKAGAVVDEAFLKRTERRIEGTPAEMDHVVATVNGKPFRYGELALAVASFAGGSGGGHLTGPTLKTQLAWREIDARLLADLAVAKGRDRDPATRALLERAEREILAAATRDQLASAARSAAERQATVQAATQALRRGATITIDEAALARAVPGT
ncbi:MAG: hypothetical protein IPO09_09165 [Anaeromyxobacter sp.]|nr:hypothetical protein [Anaeromyxobacter sp.]MBL0277598.1 hypothetical protein [Anaeromyxobacter sp.]